MSDKESLSTDKEPLLVVEEEVCVSKKELVTGRVVVESSVIEEKVNIPVSTAHQHYRQSKIPVDRVVDSMPEIRTEGDVTIVPIVREEAVITKRLVLVEEIHFTKISDREESTVPVTLRRTEVDIDRG